MPLGANMLPWLRGPELARLNRMLAYFLLLSQVSRRRSPRSLFSGLVARLVTTPIRWRLHSSLFSFPWELWLSQLSEHLVKRRSLITGQELSALAPGGGS